MLDGLRARFDAVVGRLQRFERREVHAMRLWLEQTSNLVHVSILVFVPLLIGVVTYISNALQAVSFLLFPPLASGTYTLFADPEGKYASPSKFVGGMSLGAFAGWIALEVSTRAWYGVPPGRFQVHAGAAALGIFLTGVLTWGLDLEEPTAFSAALLVLLFGGGRTLTVVGITVSVNVLYVVGVAVSSTLVAVAFSVWRSQFYEQRARYLYETVSSDDHVLVPMRGDHQRSVATFGARLAAAHDAGKVVLLDVVEDREIAATERELLDRLGGTVDPDDRREELEAEAEREVAAESVARLEREAEYIETEVGVSCDVVIAVASDDPASAVRQTVAEVDCDLVVTPYEEEGSTLSPFVQGLFVGDADVVALRATGERTRWHRVMVTVRRAGDGAHAMIDFALRLAGESGSVSVCHCIGSERQRRRAEEMLAQLVETFEGRFETRIARADIEEFVERNASNYDLVVLGASTERSPASRFLARPTFQRIREVDSDVAVVHRGR